MKVGAQLYTVRDLCKTAEEFRETLHKLYDIGYRDVQISAINLPPKEIRAICDEVGMKIIITHSSPNRILNDTAAVIEEHRLLGCDYVGIGALPGQYEKSRDGIKRFAEFTHGLQEQVDKNGIGGRILHAGHGRAFGAIADGLQPLRHVVAGAGGVGHQAEDERLAMGPGLLQNGLDEGMVVHAALRLPLLPQDADVDDGRIRIIALFAAVFLRVVRYGVAPVSYTHLTLPTIA